jgi:ferritin-like metal-binding protein YciE
MRNSAETGNFEAANILEEFLEEEKATDEKLTEIS